MLDHPFAPIFLTIVSDICYVWMDITAQSLIKQGIPAGQIVFVRMIIVTLGSMLYLISQSPHLLPTVFKSESRLLWVRGTIATVSLMSFWPSLQFISLAEAITTYHLRPFPTGFLCWLFLGEPFTRIQVTACILSFGAVLLVVQPESLFHHDPHGANDPVPTRRLLGFLLAAFAMFTSAADFLLLRRIGRVDNTLLLLIYAMTGIIVGPLSCIPAGSGFVWTLPTGAWIEILVISCTGLGAQLAFTAALQRAEGAKIAVLGYFQIIFSVIAQVIDTGGSPNWESFLGMGIIIISGAWTTLKGSEESGPAPPSDEDTEVEEGLRLHTGSIEENHRDAFSLSIPLDAPRAGYLPVPQDERV